MNGIPFVKNAKQPKQMFKLLNFTMERAKIVIWINILMILMVLITNKFKIIKVYKIRICSYKCNNNNKKKETFYNANIAILYLFIIQKKMYVQIKIA